MKRPLALALLVACNAPGAPRRARGPEPGSAPLIDANAPDPLPDDVEEASFILPPREDPKGTSFVVAPPDPNTPSEHECAVARRTNRYWCAPPGIAVTFASGGERKLGCPGFIRGKGADGSMEGTDGLPTCALAYLEPCETDVQREAGETGICCYAWSCPTHAGSPEASQGLP